jgi:mono/diheme cytochrome c family protein
MNRKIPQILIIAGTVGLLSLPVLFAADAPVIKRVQAHSTTSLAGQDLFREYCAVCHGNNAKGGGPAAAALKVKPADLTLVSHQNGGAFPELHVQRIINGEDDVTAHGSRDMPIWGQIFRSLSANEDVGSMRVYSLVKYIETMQVK